MLTFSFPLTQIHSAYTVAHVKELKSLHSKCNLFAFFPYLLNICRKFQLLISHGSVATYLRWGGYCHMGFVANFIRFPAVQTFWKSVKIWQSYKEFKAENSVLFLRAGVQPTLDPCAEAFYKQAQCASPGRWGGWLMMCASVCMTEG